MLAVQTFKDLEDTSHDLGEFRLYFEKSPTRWPIVRGGGEGFAAPVRVQPRGASPDEKGEPHMLKVYLNPVEERRQRAHFLASLGLASLPLRIKLFEAAPTLPVSHTIVVPKSGVAVAVEGYLARFVDGHTLDELVTDGWPADFAPRIAVARQLCLAIEILERGGNLVHGDLSPGNLIVLGANTPNPELRLVDFDGFHHTGVPPVPPGRGGRTWGTPGYCAPAFQKRDRSVVVYSDRVAMAILVMEIVARRDGDPLDATFLNQDEIYERRPTLPPELVARWPEGWRLVQSAIAALDPRAAPSPRQWRAALAERLQAHHLVPLASTAGPPSTAPGLGVLVYEHGKERRELKIQLPRGTFARVSDDLAWLSYEQIGDDLHLTGQPPDQRNLSFRQGGQQADLERQRGAVSVLATRGSVINWGDFEIYLG
jgi:hypothetical protein